MSFDHDLDVLVREVLQNSLDARRGDLGEPAIVRFALHELRGGRKRAALAAAHWPSLRSHVNASKHLAPQFAESLARVDAPDEPLSLLSVHDGNALGMSGPERGTGRFAMFARNKLLSDKQSADAGGAFGLGKSVLWAYSGISTVLVHSRPMPAAGYDHDSRFIGIAQLPWHELGGTQFDGPGWLGLGSEDQGEAWSVSHPAGDAALEALLLDREEEWRTGTSLCIPDFLGVQECESVAELADLLEQAAAKWFWPAMAGRPPRLLVEIAVHGDVRPVDVTGLQTVRPFLHLAGLVPQAHWSSGTASGTAPLKLPTAQDSMRGRDDFIWHSSQQVEDAFQVDAVALEEDLGELRGKLALVRGARMVVDYVDLRSDRPTYALARAGTARGEREQDRLVEQFLRLAEPPSHKDWSAKAPKLAPAYKRGYRGELNGLRRRLADRALELVKRNEADSRSVEIPKALRRALSVRSGASRGDLALKQASHESLEAARPRAVRCRPG